jgi:hypothetical protein
MRLTGRRESSNVEDRRGLSGGDLPEMKYKNKRL